MSDAQRAASNSAPLGIVLLQLGGPSSLEEVQPFLENIFQDPELFDLPTPVSLRSWLAKRLSTWRAKQATPLYAAIGGRSPIGEITSRQAEALEQVMSQTLECRVFVAMRYGTPTTAMAVEAVQNSPCNRLVLLPLYPHYSAATTGSSLRDWERKAEENGLELPTVTIASYYSLPAYIAAISERLREALGRFPARSEPHVVFSAHGLPKKFIEQGDPYRDQIEETVRLLVRDCSLGTRHTLCYQSRVGPQRWLKPSLKETLRGLGRAGTKSVLVVPVSFVSDHLETLSEINIEARKIANAWGVRHFETMTGLNDGPAFIAALAELVTSSR